MVGIFRSAELESSSSSTPPRILQKLKKKTLQDWESDFKNTATIYGTEKSSINKNKINLYNPNYYGLLNTKKSNKKLK